VCTAGLGLAGLAFELRLHRRKQSPVSAS
jgi:hypothetical protein